MHKNTLITLIFGLTLLTACASNDNPCEEILEVKQQEHMCMQLRKTMNSPNPQEALTAKKRYEEACVDLRYYRDDFDTICKAGETPIGERKKQ